MTYHVKDLEAGPLLDQAVGDAGAAAVSPEMLQRLAREAGFYLGSGESHEGYEPQLARFAQLVLQEAAKLRLQLDVALLNSEQAAQHFFATIRAQIKP